MENCIRIYDDVISKHWCEDIIKSFEETSTDRYSNGHKEFNQLEIWDQPEWYDTKLKFLNLNLNSFVLLPANLLLLIFELYRLS